MKVFEQIVFMQGDEADEPLQILDNEGEQAAMDYLKDWHYPGEHDTRAASGAGNSDNTYKKDGYIMAWNDDLEYIGLEYETNE